MANPRPIGVVIVDDHAMTRIGLAFMLKSYDDITLLGEAESAEEALEVCAASTPDVVLMDMLLGQTEGPDVITALRRELPLVQIVAVSSFDEPALVQRAIQAGAISYVLKNVSAFDLVQSIRKAHGGKATLSPEAAQGLVTQLQRPAQPQLDLSEREWAVLRLLAQGQSNGEIAAQLHLSAATVKGHVGTILSKLGVATRSEAIARAWAQGFVSRDKTTE